MMRASRVLVSGYYGFGNAGDEAILAGLVASFRQLAPEAELLVLSGDPQATTAEHGVKAAPRGLRSAFSRLQESDLFISGGGGLLQDATSWRSPLYYLAMIELALASGVPVACIGHSIGPLRRPWVRRLVRKTLSRVGVLGVRDDLSLAALKELGVTREVTVTADLAFALMPPAPEESAAAWRKAGLEQHERRSVCLALRQSPTGETGHLVSGLVASIGEACRELRLRPVLVPMQRAQDLAIADEIAAHMAVPVEVVRQALTAREILALIGRCDLVVAMRLHALIFAAICRVPMVAVSYDPKVDGLMESLGLPVAARVEAFDQQALRGAMLSAVRAREENTPPWHSRVEAMGAAALRNIQLALSLVRG